MKLHQEYKRLIHWARSLAQVVSNSENALVCSELSVLVRSTEHNERSPPQCLFQLTQEFAYYLHAVRRQPDDV